MVSLEKLRSQVAVRYDRLRLPSWPNPHPGMVRPSNEEYSRVTDPERYGIVHARARVWADTLDDLLGVDVVSLPPSPLDDEGHLGPFHRGVRLTSPRPGRLPLLLLERDVTWPGLDRSLAVLHISVVEPRVAVERLPDCGCDACDFGSEDLLHAVDETIGNLVGGPFVALRGNEWHALWHPDGGSSGSSGSSGWNLDHRDLMELCRRLAGGEPVRLPEGTRAYVGRSWLD
jgi:hypothetical protein